MAELAREWREAYVAFQQLHVHLLAITRLSLEVNAELERQLSLPFPILRDTHGDVSRAYGVVLPASGGASPSKAAGSRTVLVDTNLRVLRIYGASDSADQVRAALDFFRDHLIETPPARVLMQAPVLLIPRVLSRELCVELTRLCKTEGNDDSGFMKQVDGRTVGVYDYGHKIRRDHFLKEGPMRTRLMHILYHRVKPEIQKAFHFEVTRFEDFRIACYEATRGGYFRAYRDNTTDDTAHRRWAMSLNLNEEEYEGGDLRFPEYGPHRYRPRTGEAVIFSCSLLHEATDVTAGRRFVLLSFLYGEREARLREETARNRGAAYQTAYANREGL